jgi:uncharacterized membrane protein
MDALATVWIIRLLGRFHPTTIHFPIAFLLAAAALELGGILRKKPFLPDLLFFSLSIGTAGALVSAPLGWADAASIRFDQGDALALGVHRWLGTFVAASSAAAWILLAGLRKGRFAGLWPIFRAALFASALAVGVGAHFGGILVYGHDYYSSALAADESPARAGASATRPEAGRITFEGTTGPLFQEHCVKCHGPRKQKGRLRLDSRDAVLRGGKSGPAVLPGDSAHSILFRAITDPNPDTRMPQEAPPLPAEKIEEIRAWINEGAP